MRKQRTAALLLGLIGLLAGCGGGAPPAASTGSATFTVLWPATRVIPQNTRSVRITLSRAQNNAVVADRVLTPPAQGGSSAVTIANLPLGRLVAVIAAHPDAEGTGVPLARTETSLEIAADRATPVDVALASTVAAIEMGPVPAPLIAGQSVALAATPRDAAGRIVPVAPESLLWRSDAPAVAEVDAAGTVIARRAGAARIQVTERDSGRSAAVTVAVRVHVVLSPETATLTLGDTRQFTATVTGTENTGVNWSVREGAAGGTVDAGGLYTAPGEPGTYHVVAASRADSGQRAEAVVIVQAGDGVVIVQ